MLLPSEIVPLIFVAALTLLGLAANSFIVVVNGIDWVKTRRLSANDIILTSLGIVRFLYQWSVMLNRIMVMVYTNGSTLAEFTNVIFCMWTCLDLVNAWFSAWLSVFYCVKIANHRHPIFIFLKLKILQTVPCLLLGSMLASLVTSIPLAWTFKNLQSNSTIYPCSNNRSELIDCSLAWKMYRRNHSNSDDDASPKRASEVNSKLDIYYTYLLPVLCLGYSLPFFIFCAALLLLIRSLCGHTWRMKDNCIPSLEVYFTAIKVMVSFLLLYVSNFICVIFRVSDLVCTESLSFVVILLVHAAYPSLHSVILIRSNSKLRKVLERIFHHAEILRHQQSEGRICPSIESLAGQEDFEATSFDITHIFYCVKIPNQRRPVFIFVKLKIPRTIPWLLLGSMLASLVTSLT
uniref:Taste receptor type 2 member 40 n=1 Tax=Geotrypetes seraphini TaxID=260995 RepID=A0A6P8SR18_GEOSA|nr:taste receptor type 2 member 41-like [Geotrypetes seraphini]